ncbi:MAG: outer-membrane lipoprotein carrier protein LolA [Tannerella sp.]|nr:outer-membrane lipoprotein carrier protein LolA [Tannerella sp.]
MKKYLYTAFSCLAVVFSAEAQQAEVILDKAAAAYESSNGIKAAFSANIRYEKEHISESFEGTIQMKGDKFVLTAPDMRTWFDGKTQWTYMVRTQEVNISIPSGDELQFANPMILLRNYKKGFSLSYTGESTADNGKMADDVLLVSKGNDEIDQVEMQIDKATALPVRITVTMKNGIRSVIRIGKMQTKQHQPDQLFVYNPDDYPEAVEIDLR